MSQQEHRIKSTSIQITTGAVITIVIIGTAIFIGTGLLYALFVGFDISQKSGEWANFGTFYGGVLGPLLSLFAFLGLVLTLRYQAIQIAELERTSEQNRLEQTIGGLITSLGQISGAISIKSTNEEPSTDGTKAFRTLYIAFARRFREVKALYGPDSEESVIAAYDRFYSAYGSYVGHYFRTFYTIVRIIDEQAPTRAEAERLVALLTCRLSRYELLLLHYNGASELGSRKLKPLISKYGILENMDVIKLLRYRHLQLYPHTAFGIHRRPT